MWRENGISESLGCLILAQPTEPFFDYELFEIDQALMRGTNLAVFTDAFEEVPQPPQQRFQFNMGPTTSRWIRGWRIFWPITASGSTLLCHG
ncbi:MAG: Gldg family protein [Desulfobacterales bacterium]